MASAVYTPNATTVSGVVTAVNPKGVKLAGESDWLNFSKFATDLVIPERGEAVLLLLDKSGFIRSVQPAVGPARSSGTASPQNAPRGQYGPAGASAKDRTITRLAVLKAAAEYAASKPQSSSGDVLKIAASWERWVLRDDEPAELVDAF